MRSNNICKFIQPGQEIGLSVSCFILETNLDVIHKKILLTTHRIILVTKGEGSFFFSGQKTSFTAGNLIFGFKDELFHAETEKECEFMYIQFDGDRANELFTRFNIQKITAVFRVLTVLCRCGKKACPEQRNKQSIWYQRVFCSIPFLG